MQFWYILKNSIQKPIYDGDPYDLVFAVYPELAKEYRTHVKSNKRFSTLHVTCFDQLYSFSCLSIPVEPWQLKDNHQDKMLQDVTEAFYDWIQNLIDSMEISSDRSIVRWKNFIKMHKVFIDPDDAYETPIFFQIPEKKYDVILSPAQKKIKLKKWESIQSNILPSAQNIRIPSPYDPSLYQDKSDRISIPEYRSLLYEKKKQVLDWFLRLTPLIHKWLSTPVWQNIEYDEPSIMSDWATSFVQLWAYSDSLRELWYWKWKMMRYHGRYLQNWQILSKIYLWWITCIVAPRRWGKTDMASLIIDEALFSERSDWQPITIMWVGINRKKNKTARNYIRRKLKAMYDEWMVIWNNQEQSLSLIETIKNPNSRDWRWDYIENVKATIYFIGAWDEEAWVGDAADLIIVDEVARIDKIHPEVIDDLMAIVNNEQARIVFISTLDWKTKKTRFYDWLKKWEYDEMKRNMNWESIYELIDKYWTDYRDVLENKNWLSDEETLIAMNDIKLELMMKRQYVGIRFTWEDIDIWTEQQRIAAKEQAASQNYDKYIAEWRWVFPNEIQALQNIEKSYIDQDKVPDRYPLIIIAYDPANWWSDNKPIVALWYCNDPNHPCYNSLIQFDEKELSWWIEQQIPQVIKYKNEIFMRHGMEKWRNFFIYDGKWLGETMDILFKQSKTKINWIIKNHSWPDHKEWDWLILYPSKTKWVEEMCSLAINWAFYISKKCIKTINEHTTYEKIDTWWPVWYTYQAQKWKQDWHVSASVMWVYYWYNVLWLKIPIMKWIASKIIDFEEENEIEETKDYYGPWRVKSMMSREKMNLALSRFKNWKIRF